MDAFKVGTSASGEPNVKLGCACPRRGRGGTQHGIKTHKGRNPRPTQPYSKSLDISFPPACAAGPADFTGVAEHGRTADHVQFANTLGQIAGCFCGHHVPAAVHRANLLRLASVSSRRTFSDRDGATSAADDAAATVPSKAPVTL